MSRAIDPSFGTVVFRKMDDDADDGNDGDDDDDEEEDGEEDGEVLLELEE